MYIVQDNAHVSLAILHILLFQHDDLQPSSPEKWQHMSKESTSCRLGESSDCDKAAQGSVLRCSKANQIS